MIAVAQIGSILSCNSFLPGLQQLVLAAKIPRCSLPRQAMAPSIPVLLFLHQLPPLCCHLLLLLLLLKVACNSDFRLKPVHIPLVNAPFHLFSRTQLHLFMVLLFYSLAAMLRPSSAGSRPWGLRAGSPLVRTLQVCASKPSFPWVFSCLILCNPLSGCRVFCHLHFPSHWNGSSHPCKRSLAGSAIVIVTFYTQAFVKYQAPLNHRGMSSAESLFFHRYPLMMPADDKVNKFNFK